MTKAVSPETQEEEVLFVPTPEEIRERMQKLLPARIGELVSEGSPLNRRARVLNTASALQEVARDRSVAADPAA